ncbi:hypothetical protein SIO70_04940 [Chitinophaga sancti]|uniref:hypothetical protein n=1 Tax=Chitinophaga sancti TaxID=1004 RepID=UPI002A75F15E|nr:hypothetical protein [Chitinophaga sancti]WPQ64208.1 hypothetical protein SIO70_04940 [Chitinophaga sancti]
MKICSVFLLLFLGFNVVKGQNKLSVAPLYPLQKKMTPSITFVKPTTAVTFTPKATLPLTPHSYYDQCFGFFCKKEWNFEQRTKVPLKFRLGTYQEAQRIEGK